MDTQQPAEVTKDEAEKSKESKAEKTSTQYKPPVCEDDLESESSREPDFAKEIVSRVNRKGHELIIEMGEKKPKKNGKDATQPPTSSRPSSVTWASLPLSNTCSSTQSDAATRFSEATTAVTGRSNEDQPSPPENLAPTANLAGRRRPTLRRDERPSSSRNTPRAPSTQTGSVTSRGSPAERRTIVETEEMQDCTDPSCTECVAAGSHRADLSQQASSINPANVEDHEVEGRDQESKVEDYRSDGEIRSENPVHRASLQQPHQDAFPEVLETESSTATQPQFIRRTINLIHRATSGASSAEDDDTASIFDVPCSMVTSELLDDCPIISTPYSRSARPQRDYPARPRTQSKTPPRAHRTMPRPPLGRHRQSGPHSSSPKPLRNDPYTYKDPNYSGTFVMHPALSSAPYHFARQNQSLPREYQVSEELPRQQVHYLDQRQTLPRPQVPEFYQIPPVSMHLQQYLDQPQSEPKQNYGFVPPLVGPNLRKGSAYGQLLQSHTDPYMSFPRSQGNPSKAPSEPSGMSAMHSSAPHASKSRSSSPLSQQTPTAPREVVPQAVPDPGLATDAVAVQLSTPASLPCARPPATPDLTRDIDPIELVEEYLGTLERIKMKEFLDARKILSYIDDHRASRNEETAQPSGSDYYPVSDNGSSDSDVSDEPTRFPTPARARPMPRSSKAKSQRRIAEGRVEGSVQEGLKSTTGIMYSDNTPLPSCTNTAGVQAVKANHVVHLQIPNHTDDHLNDELANLAENDMRQELESMRHDMAALQRQLDHKDAKRAASTASSAYSRLKNYFRKGPPLGTQRLEWICECGEEMCADLPLTNSAQYQQMLAFLTSPAPRERPTGHGFAPPSDLESGTAGSNFSSPHPSQNSPNSFTNGKTPASTIGSTGTYVGSSSSQSITLPGQNPYSRAKYLEVCVNVGKYETKLAEIQVTSSSAIGSTICTDAHLFRKIHDGYFKLRKHTWRRFLYRPAGIKFVHFGVQAGHQVGFFAGKSPCLPSKEALATKSYEFNLQPPVPPPIDSRTFLHYFWKHGAHSQSTSAKYVDRLPKKLGESLVRSLGPDELREGWGIHILEGPNKPAICWALLSVLVASFGVSLGYDLIVKGGESGFAIGQWVVAALTVALSTLYFSLEDEVISGFD